MMKKLYDFLNEKKYGDRVDIKPYGTWMEIKVSPNIKTQGKIEISGTLGEGNFTIDSIIESINAILEKKIYN